MSSPLSLPAVTPGMLPRCPSACSSIRNLIYLGFFFPTLAGLACWMLERAPSHGDGPVGLVDDLH